MKELKVSEECYNRLLHLCKEWFVCKGDKPKSPNKAVEDLINDKFNEAYPREYQTTGFDRQ